MIKVFLEQKKTTQSYILEFIENEIDSEENYEKLIRFIKAQNIIKDTENLLAILYLILAISNNHYRSSTFFNKIEKILLYFKEIITKNFSNDFIYIFFQENKRLLLFLIEEHILIIDKNIATKISLKNLDYSSYLFPEINYFLTLAAKKKIQRHFNNENFEEKRKEGVNDDHLSQIIRNDSIEELITYLNKEQLSFSAIIKTSIFETNSFLIENKKDLSLIKYAAFYGSIQVFKYLHLNGAILDQSIWLYSIHSNNPELIYYLHDEIKFLCTNGTLKKMFEESLKCHHNEMANYILNNYLSNDEDEDDDEYIFKYYNFQFFPFYLRKGHVFYYLCKYNYISLVDILLKNYKININRITEDEIQEILFLLI